MLDESEIVRIIGEEISNCSDRLVEKKREAVAYYEGELPKPLGVAGRSSVVSTDVADAIHWLMPNIIESLNGRSVEFMPMSAQDEMQSDLESDMTHFTFSEENTGFSVLYSAVKDALLAGVGIMKIYYDSTPERVVEHYDGLDENQLNALLADEAVEVTQIERSQTDGIHVIAARIIRQGRVKIEAVPAEEFRVNSDADSLNLQEARFVCHTTRRTASDLIAAGYDPDVVEAAATHYLEREVGDYSLPSELDESQKEIVVSECYLRLDVNEDGIGELVKVTVVGESTPTDILDLEEVAEIPFVAMSAMPMPHEFMGVSVFDRVRTLQDIKTSIMRATLDSAYHSIHKQRVVLEGAVNVDDLLVNRPGSIIRSKQPNAIQELGGNFFGGECLQLLQYVDTMKDSRVGVSPNMAGQDALVGQESAHGVERLQSAREMLVQLMIRAVAETGMRPAYRMIRDLLVRYQNGTIPYKHKGVWLNVNPSTWGPRSRMTVTVGSGAADTQQKLMNLQATLGVQQQMMQMDPLNPLVDYNKVYQTLSEITDLSGIGQGEQFFYNPMSEEGQAFAGQKMQQGQMQQQQAMAEQQAQMQMQQAALQAQQTVANAEAQKAQATQENGRLKAQIDAINNSHKAELERMKNEIAAAEKASQQSFQLRKLQTDAALRLTELEVNAKKDLSKQNEDNKKDASSVSEASK